jgi:hypothetical protein
VETARLGPFNRRYAGIQSIRLDQIVGIDSRIATPTATSCPSAPSSVYLAALDAARDVLAGDQKAPGARVRRLVGLT